MCSKRRTGHQHRTDDGGGQGADGAGGAGLFLHFAQTLAVVDLAGVLVGPAAIRFTSSGAIERRLFTAPGAQVRMLVFELHGNVVSNSDGGMPQAVLQGWGWCNRSSCGAYWPRGANRFRCFCLCVCMRAQMPAKMRVDGFSD